MQGRDTPEVGHALTTSVGPTAQASAASAARALLVRRAREDFAVFVEGLHRDIGLRVAPFQREWHRVVEQNDRVVIWAPVEHGKSVQMTVAYAVWRLGRDPKLHGLIVGATATAAEKRLSAIRQLIDESPWVHEVFPALRPVKGKYAKWTDQAIRVEGIALGDQDYSLQAIGFGGSILGARLDLLIGDDLVTFETSATHLQRRKVIDWWLSTLVGRLLPAAKVVLLGNAWFPDDLMHFLVRESGYVEHRTEAYRERPDGSIDPDSILWPERWSLARLEQRIQELGSVVEARRQLRCIAYASGSSQFDLEWFDRAFTLGEQLWGETFGKLLPRFLPRYDGPMVVKTGVDLGVSRKETADYTSLFTIAVDTTTNRRFPIFVERGRWTGPQIVQRLRRVHALYGGEIVVENNGAQEYLLQFTRDAGIPVRATTTGSSKADPRFGVPSLAQELEMGLWALPLEEAIHHWRADCLSYSPDKHVGDTLMASWFAREAARQAQYVEAGVVDPEVERRSHARQLRARYGGLATSARRLRLVS